MNARTLLTLLLCASLTSCFGLRGDRLSDFGKTGLLLAEAEDEDGSPIQWRLYPGRKGAPRIDRTRWTKTQTPRIGVTTSSVSRARAETFGVEAFEGVWIDSVSVGSPAARAGLVKGDIVVSVDGENVRGVDHFGDLILTHGEPGEELQLGLRIYRKGGEPTNGGARVETLTVVPEAREVTESDTEAFELEYSKGVQRYTGMQVASIPPSVSRDVFGEDEDVVMVSGVLTGSPAYHAGLRIGDRVRRCDGHAVASLDDVRAAVALRIDDDDELVDLAGLTAGREQADDDEFDLEVESMQLGPLTTSLDVDPDLGDDVKFSIPIVTSYRSDLRGARWSFLDFIFQFGFNYRSNTLPSATRKPVETWELSLFPFGMFEFEKGVDSREYTFFWFIDFESNS